MYNLYNLEKLLRKKSHLKRICPIGDLLYVVLLRRRKYDHDFRKIQLNFAKIMELKHFIDQQADSLFYSNAK